jgi:uncharacterized protein YceH (UPF0502 family)
MEIILSDPETRVLGCLIEKELSTPEYYPLTVNSLTAACNQKSNRNPVLTLTDKDVQTALELLKGKTLAWQMNLTGSRVPKYEHNLGPKFGLTQQEMSVLCALMVHGPLTPGEIRGCSGRLFPFKDPEEVLTTLEGLIDNSQGPFVARLPKVPGRKEHRFAHLFSGTPDISKLGAVSSASSADCLNEFAAPIDSLACMQEKIDLLSAELADLKQAFIDFKKSFD